mmetsp:Transcript_5456/g.8493  ORF Transcript_5456/g.8493 Transcript_5456/m.8493 type:complete len:102 (+) Transcript_5456:378-683(+)
MNDKRVFLPTFERSQMIGNIHKQQVNQPKNFYNRQLPEPHEGTLFRQNSEMTTPNQLLKNEAQGTASFASLQPVQSEMKSQPRRTIPRPDDGDLCQEITNS